MQTLDNPRVCAICQKDFCMISSMGRLECREHASSFINKDPKSGKYYWPCCMQECFYSTPEAFYKSRPHLLHSGCIRADHKSEMTPYSVREPSNFSDSRYEEGYPSIKLPAALIKKQLKTVDKDVIVELEKNEVEVLMYDYKGKKEVLKNRKKQINSY